MTATTAEVPAHAALVAQSCGIMSLVEVQTSNPSFMRYLRGMRFPAAWRLAGMAEKSPKTPQSM